MIKSIVITGDKAADKILSNLPDALQRKIMISAFRKAARPMVNEMKRLSPMDQGGPRKYRGNLHIPGTLKKSHGIVVGKSKQYPTVWIGPRMGKRYKYDGFYFKFIIEGSDALAKQIDRPKENWIKKAGNKTKAQVNSIITLEITKSLDRTMRSAIRRAGGTPL